MARLEPRPIVHPDTRSSRRRSRSRTDRNEGMRSDGDTEDHVVFDDDVGSESDVHADDSRGRDGGIAFLSVTVRRQM